MTLEHFKYPQFIRKTKKAYISIVNDQILKIAQNCGEHSYNAVRLHKEKRIGVCIWHIVEKYLLPTLEIRELRRKLLICFKDCLRGFRMKEKLSQRH